MSSTDDLARRLFGTTANDTSERERQQGEESSAPQQGEPPTDWLRAALRRATRDKSSGG